MIVDNFDQLLAVMSDKKTYIYQSQNSTSLHFTITAVQSEMCPKSPNKLVLGYTRTMMGFLLFKPEPKNIAMIGLGGGSLPKYCYAYLPDSHIVVVENNAEVIGLREHFFIPQDDARFHVLCADGADFVKDRSRQLDVLIIDGFEEHGQPAQLCTSDFYHDCFHALAHDGVMVVNFLEYDFKNTRMLERIGAIFNGAVVIADAQESMNKIVFAFKGDIGEVTDEVLLSRLKLLTQQHPVSLAKTARNILVKRRAKKRQLFIETIE